MRPLSAAFLVVLSTACAASQSEHGANGAGSQTTAKNADAGTVADGGEARPFAGSAAEATSYISTIVDKKQADIAQCVREFRVRKKIARARVTLSFGIDQEGKVLGVTSKTKDDEELRMCVHDALKGAPFPRSHAGVITVTKTYEEFVQ